MFVWIFHRLLLGLGQCPCSPSPTIWNYIILKASIIGGISILDPQDANKQIKYDHKTSCFIFECSARDKRVFRVQLSVCIKKSSDGHSWGTTEFYWNMEFELSLELVFEEEWVFNVALSIGLVPDSQTSRFLPPWYTHKSKMNTEFE